MRLNKTANKNSAFVIQLLVTINQIIEHIDIEIVLDAPTIVLCTCGPLVFII